MNRITSMLTTTILAVMIVFFFFPPDLTSASDLGNFGSSSSTNLPTTDAYSYIGVGDINGDSNPDIAFGGNDYGSSNTHGLYVYTGDGDGSWTDASEGLPTVDSWGGLALGDADNDGQIELYASNTWYDSYSGPDRGVGAWEYSSGVWSNDGISSPLTTGVVNNVLVDDIAGSVDLDIVICSSKQPSFGLSVKTGSGTDPIIWTDFSEGLPTSGQFTGVDVLDINGDGLKDIVAAGYWSSTGLRIYIQTETGWDDGSSSLPSAAYSGDMIGVTLGDVNSDGHVDIVYSQLNRGLYILLGNSGGTDGTTFTWTTPTSSNGGFPSSATSRTFSQIQLEDIDQDGDLDLLAPKDDSGLHLYLGDGSITPGTGFVFSEVTNLGLPTSGFYYGSDFIDYDGDGDLDVVGATWGGGVKVQETILSPGEPDDGDPDPDEDESEPVDNDEQNEDLSENIDDEENTIIESGNSNSKNHLGFITGAILILLVLVATTLVFMIFIKRKKMKDQ